MRMKIFLLMLAVPVSFQCELSAHETLFGRAPGLMWFDGTSIEFESEFGFAKRMFEDRNPADNPLDERESMSESMLRVMYGVQSEWGIGADFPYVAIRESNKAGTESVSGFGDVRLDSRYRIYNAPFLGGSYSTAVYSTVRVPTGKQADEGPSLGDGTWGFYPGVNYLYSSLLDYYWLEFNGVINTENDRHREGSEFNVHFAYATRLTEIVDFREFDFIVLAEADFTARDRDNDGGDPDVNSGYEQFSLGGGVQLNYGVQGKRANFFVGKFGVNVPVYRRVNGTQLMDEVEVELSLGIAF